MTRPHTAVLALAVLIGACVRNPGAEPPAPPAGPYVDGPIDIGRWGVGPIRSTTFFEAPRIRELFPKAKVAETEISIPPDETLSVITVRQNDQPLLEIDDSDRYTNGDEDPPIGKVRGIGAPVRGPRGERLGMSWTSAGFDLTQCEPGQDEDKNRMVCARPGDGAVNYVFAVPGWDSLEIPPIARLRSSAVLTEIVWIPPHRPRA